MFMRCLYCDRPIDKITFKSLLIKQDPLCKKCRNDMKYHKRYVTIDGCKVELAYHYDSLFKSILLQYKECYDEALKDVFLYNLNEYLYLKYHGYQILLIPSSLNKLNLRGFNHLELIFENVGLRLNYGLKMKQELIQEAKNMMDRRKMIDNYYYQGDIPEKILIVDDVLTSGSSLIGAKRCIQKYTKNIKMFVLSR